MDCKQILEVLNGNLEQIIQIIQFVREFDRRWTNPVGWQASYHN